jgi:hypothetical protein
LAYVKDNTRIDFRKFVCEDVDWIIVLSFRQLPLRFDKIMELLESWSKFEFAKQNLLSFS